MKNGLDLPQPASPNTDIILIRHGETDWNVERRLQGFIDIPLNAHGHRQAESLALALRDDSFSVVCTSDLQRARATAERICLDRGARLHVEPALRERSFGAFEGLRRPDIEALHPEAFRAWQAREHDAVLPDGRQPAETLAGFYDRAITAVTRLAVLYAGQTIVVVAHGGVLDCIYREAAGVALAVPCAVDLRNAGINRLTFDDKHLRVKEWGAVNHLPTPSLDEIKEDPST